MSRTLRQLISDFGDTPASGLEAFWASLNPDESDALQAWRDRCASDLRELLAEAREEGA